MSKITGYKTVDMEMSSFFDPSFKFQVGVERIVTLTDQDKRKYGSDSCGVGLHFSPTIDAAKSYARTFPHLLFEVVSDEKYLIGKDNNKYRVSRLTLVREIDSVAAAREALAKEEALRKERLAKAAAFDKEIKSFKNYFLQPKGITKQKIVSNVNAWFKQSKYTGKLNLKFTENVFEAMYYANNCYAWHDKISSSILDMKNLEMKNLHVDSDDSLFTCAEQLVDNYKYSTINEDKKKGLDKMFELLQLGVLPMLINCTSNNLTVMVYIASKNLYKQKFP